MRRDTATHTCFACGECIEDEKPIVIDDVVDGSIWHSHSKDECLQKPTPSQVARLEEP